MGSTPSPAPDTGELLRLVGVSLDYGQVEALKDVNLPLSPSTVHAIVGEHGAGKSSIGMIISGNVKPKKGYIEFKNRRYDHLTPQLAHRMGIEMVYQQIQLDDYFSVAENIFFLNKKLARHGFVSRRALLREAEWLLSSFDFTLDPATMVKHLNLPDRALTSILGALQKRPKLLILDEALEKLSTGDLHKVLRVLDLMKREGMSILFITHRIDDVYDIADRVSIVKGGEILVTDDVGHIDKMNLLKLTYTQVYSLEDSGNLKRRFSQFLKYNEAVFLNLPVNLMVVDAHERVEIVNESCKAYFHREGEPFVNQPLAQLLGAQNDGTLALIRKALLSDQGEAFYHVPLLINGSETVNNIRTLPIYDEKTLIGSIILIEDVTEFDKLQKQVILSEKLASVGLLAAGVAHEINNPLEIIYNYLKYLRVSFDDEKLREAVDDLHEEITYIAGIVRNLLSLSNTDQVEKETIDINELIRNTLSLLKHNADYKHISITFHSSQHSLPLTANKGEMKQVILNLVKNSFEAMPTGGDIRIETTRTLDAQGQPSVRMTFTDTGHGIQEANLSNVFIPFYSTRKGKGDNIGLGLSICYGIVQRHRGSMGVTNMEKSGCQFTITLPESPTRSANP